MNIKPNTHYWAWYECRKAIIVTDTKGTGFFALGQDTYRRMDCAEIIAEAVTPEYFQQCLQQKSRDNEAINRNRMLYIEANDRANKIIGQQADELMAMTQNPENKIELSSINESRKFLEDCMRAAIRDKEQQIDGLKKQLEALENKRT